MTEQRRAWVASRQSLAILRHPDQRTAWIVVLVGRLREPVAGLEQRLQAVHDTVPLVGARLVGETWLDGVVPSVTEVDGDVLEHSAVRDRFDLATEPPVRVLVERGCTTLALVAHHAAFDGLGLTRILDALLGGTLPQPPADFGAGRGAYRPAPTLRRFLRPVDRVAPSPTPPPWDSFVARDVPAVGRGFTARLAGAALRAVGGHNRARGWPWRTAGLSIAVGGPAGAGNVASYRRLDLSTDAPAVDLVSSAVARDEEPGELARAVRGMRLLGALADRLSDSVLVSNLGLHDSLPLERLEFFPVARGRSAVAVGAAGVRPGTATVTLRARDLDPADAEALLDALVAHLQRA